MVPPLLAKQSAEETDRLARLAADSSRPESERQKAFELLIPSIHWVAQRLSLRFCGQPRDDLVSDAPADLWQVIDQFPPGGKFEPWCYVVLRNRWIDLVSRERKRSDFDPTSFVLPADSRDLRLAVEKSMDLAQPFSSEDLETVRGWKCRERLVLLCLTGLWKKVPTAEWLRWVALHRDCHGVPDGDEFPPAQICRCDQLAERNGLLADSLRIKRNTLSVLLHRGKTQLLNLRYLRDLIQPEKGSHS